MPQTNYINAYYKQIARLYCVEVYTTVKTKTKHKKNRKKKKILNNILGLHNVDTYYVYHGWEKLNQNDKKQKQKIYTQNSMKYTILAQKKGRQ